jgi:hypothetical protein
MTRDIDILSTSRRDDGDIGDRVMYMGIAYQRYFNFLICYFIFVFLKFTNLIFKFEKYRKTNNMGHWRWMKQDCRDDWMPIHIVMMTSSIIRGRLRQGTGGKRTSTCSSRQPISSSCVCESIFKSCLLTLMMRSSDGIIFIINFTPSVNLFCRYTWVLIFFVGTQSVLIGFVRVRDVLE